MTAPLTNAAVPPETTAATPPSPTHVVGDGTFALQLADFETSDEQSPETSEDTAPKQAPTAQEAASILLAAPVLDKVPVQATVPNAAVVVNAQATAPKIDARRIDIKQVRGELAFGLRVSEQKPAVAATVQPEATASAEELLPPASQETPEAVQAVKLTAQRPLLDKDATVQPPKPRKEGKPDASPQALAASSSTQTSAAMTTPTSATAEPARTFAAPRITSPEAPQRTEAIQEPPKLLPARQIAVRVESPENAHSPAKSVDLVVEQRGAALHFAVRSADPVLTAELRNSLNDLTSRLETQGLRSDVTRPAQIAIAATDGGFLRQSSDGSDQSHNNDWSQGGGESKHGGGRREQSQQQRDEQQPEWFSEWEQGLFTPARTTA